MKIHLPVNRNGESFLKYPVDTIIFSGAAEHRQYPDAEQDVQIHELQDHEFETYKALAKTEGFSYDDPFTFSILHVYPSCVGAFISSLKNSPELNLNPASSF